MQFFWYAIEFMMDTYGMQRAKILSALRLFVPKSAVGVVVVVAVYWRFDQAFHIGSFHTTVPMDDVQCAGCPFFWSTYRTIDSHDPHYATR
jgi:hypothetical protein